MKSRTRAAATKVADPRAKYMRPHMNQQKKGLRSEGTEALGIGLTRSSEGKYRALFCQSLTTLYIEWYADSVRSPC